MLKSNQNTNYLVYKTTNLINNKIYIGVHKQEGVNFDGYLGSGKALKQSISKHGKEFFLRETLYTFKTKEEAYSMERSLVSDNEVKNPYYYNIKVGGKGGGSLNHFTKDIRVKAKYNSNKSLIERYGNNWSQLHTKEARLKAKLNSSVSRKLKYSSSLINLNNTETQQKALSSRIKSLEERYLKEINRIKDTIEVCNFQTNLVVWKGPLLLINKDFKTLDHPKQSIREVRRVWNYLNKKSAYPYFKFRGVKYVAKFV